MKYVFLDCDGVINNNYTTNVWGDYVGADKELVEKLNVFVRDNIQFILSSTWREYNELNEIETYFVSMGFKGKLSDKTPVRWSGDRDAEIRNWLDAHGNPTEFVILDDTNYFKYNEFLKTKFVHVSGAVGLTDRDVEQALTILGEK